LRSNVQNIKAQSKFSKRWSILFEPYLEKWLWWHAVILIRRTAFVAASVISDDQTRKLIFTYLNLTFLVLQVLVTPYVRSLDNRSETLSLLVLTVLSVLMTPYSPPYGPAISLMIVLLIAIPAIIFCGLILFHTVIPLCKTHVGLVRNMSFRKRTRSKGAQDNQSSPISELHQGRSLSPHRTPADGSPLAVNRLAKMQSTDDGRFPTIEEEEPSQQASVTSFAAPPLSLAFPSGASASAVVLSPVPPSDGLPSSSGLSGPAGPDLAPLEQLCRSSSEGMKQELKEDSPSPVPQPLSVAVAEPDYEDETAPENAPETRVPPLSIASSLASRRLFVPTALMNTSLAFEVKPPSPHVRTRAVPAIPPPPTAPLTPLTPLPLTPVTPSSPASLTPPEQLDSSLDLDVPAQSQQ